MTKYDIVHVVAALKDMYPDLKKAVIKLNDGFSGDDNAIIKYPDHVEKKNYLNGYIITYIKRLYRLHKI